MTSRCAPQAARPVKGRAAFFTAVVPKPFEATVARLLSRLPAGAGQAFANLLDVSAAWVSRMKDPGDPTHLRASRVADACQALGSLEPVDELFADVRINGHRWRMAPVPEVADSADLIFDSLELAGQAGAYVSAVGRALADGHIDPSEAAELDDKLAELEDQVASLRAGLRAARSGAA